MVLSVNEMKALEQRAEKLGVTFAEMARRAGKGIARRIDRHLKKLTPKSCIGLVGTGNNGSDALIALGELSRRGWDTTALLIRPRGDDALLIELRDAGGKIVRFEEISDDFERLSGLFKQNALILDGLLGTGTRLPLAADFAKLLAFAKQYEHSHTVAAVDCPSGINCQTGEASPQTLRAARTYCLEAVKIGLLSSPAQEYAGQVHVVHLDLPEEAFSMAKPSAEVINRRLAARLLPKRADVSHKGSFGSALVIAGSVHYTGAAILATQAALRSGAGLVFAAIPRAIHAPLAAAAPEAIWETLPDEAGAIASEAAPLAATAIAARQAWLIGPGIGLGASTGEFFARLFEDEIPRIKSCPPAVVDADGLRLFTGLPAWHELLPPGSVLTPHPGEMAGMTGLSIEEIQANRPGLAKKFAEIWHSCVVLKGASTLIAAPDGRVRVLLLAASALAHGGSGDVLAGLITGLMAQGMDAFDAASLAVWLHGRAARRAERQTGHAAATLPSDLVGQLGHVMRGLSSRRGH